MQQQLSAETKKGKKLIWSDNRPAYLEASKVS